MRNSNRSALVIVALAATMTVAFHHGTHAQSTDWPAYGGDPGGMKYSPVTQIDRLNVSRLTVAWTWETREEPVPGTSTLARTLASAFLLLGAIVLGRRAVAGDR